MQPSSCEEFAIGDDSLTVEPGTVLSTPVFQGLKEVHPGGRQAFTGCRDLVTEAV